MSSILRKVLSLPNLIKKRKSQQKIDKLCELTYEYRPPRPSNWLFLERCQLMTELVDYFIELYKEEEEEGQAEVWYWANDINEEYPMTYRLGLESTVLDSLLHCQWLDSSSTVPLTRAQQTDMARYFKTYRPPR